jgi:ABC-2 type transport system permease protein
MTRSTLYDRLGIDRDQWQALVRAAIKLDFRTVGLDLRGRRPSGGPLRMVLRVSLIYVLTGAMLGAIVLAARDEFTSGVLIVSAAMFLVALSVLVEYHAVVVSPDDHLVIGALPVSSRTYFAARLTNLLFYILLQATAFGLLPVLAYTFAGGFRPHLGLAAAAALYLSSTTSALAMVSLYAALLRFVHPTRLKRVLSYVQLALSFVVYGGWALLVQFAGTRSRGALEPIDSAWWFFNPASWFASYLELALGSLSPRHWLSAAGSLILLATLGVLALRYLSFDYSERLGALSAAGERPREARAGARLPVFRRNEGRAVALLIRAQFRQDLRFRLSVLSILPLTLVYLFYGLRQGPLLDPFVHPDSALQGWFLLYMAVLAFPLILIPQMAQSDAYRASWIFYSTPASRPALVLSMKGFMTAYFVLPYLAFVGLIMSYFFESVFHVILHMMVLALVGHITLQIAVRLLPGLPFSQPVQKGSQPGRFLAMWLVLSAVSAVILPALSFWIYPSLARSVATLVGLGLATSLLERVLRMRLERLTSGMEFAD